MTNEFVRKRNYTALLKPKFFIPIACAIPIIGWLASGSSDVFSLLMGVLLFGGVAFFTDLVGYAGHRKELKDKHGFDGYLSWFIDRPRK